MAIDHVCGVDRIFAPGSKLFDGTVNTVSRALGIIESSTDESTFYRNVS